MIKTAIKNREKLEVNLKRSFVESWNLRNCESFLAPPYTVPRGVGLVLPEQYTSFTIALLSVATSEFKLMYNGSISLECF